MVESFSSRWLFELHFRSTPVLSVRQARFQDFFGTADGQLRIFAGGWTFTELSEHFQLRLILRRGLREFDRVPRMSSRSGIARTSWKSLDFEARVAERTGREWE